LKPERPRVYGTPEEEASTYAKHFLNCFEIIDTPLNWHVSIYDVERIDGQSLSNDERGNLKGIFWDLYRRHKTLCTGYGFVIPIGASTVAIPAKWNIPSGVDQAGCRVILREKLTTNPYDLKSTGIIDGILREGLKKYIKDNRSESLGDLWQNYNSFCQIPPDHSNRFCFCRSFDIKAKMLKGNMWVLEIVISTVTVDGRTFRDYYSDGTVCRLIEMIDLKQKNRSSRQNEPISVRVIRKEESAGMYPRLSVLELADETKLKQHGAFSSEDQVSLQNETVLCETFNKPPIEVPSREIRLILDSQLTQESHSETIIEPAERNAIITCVRDFINGAEIYGKNISLSPTLLRTDDNFPNILIKPPAVRVNDENGEKSIISSPTVVAPEDLRKRAKDRHRHIVKYGFVVSRPVKPLLACPKEYGKERTKRLRNDLNYYMRKMGIEYRFDQWFLYSNIPSIRKQIELGNFDCLLAVLPERASNPLSLNDTHEQIKQQIEVPSQCIYHDNTLPADFIFQKPKEIKMANPKLMMRIKNKYEACILNLLVKHNWVPFVPIDSFNYNVQVGLDVGGRHNNRVMACLGYGFQNPEEGLVFRPEEIPIDLNKAEPIPTNYLYSGLLSIFDIVYNEITSLGIAPNLDQVLFFRDGRFLGAGDDWNEIQALVQLHDELRRRGWVSDDSIWTAVEIQKRAEGWRLLRAEFPDGEIRNPVVGHCVLPFIGENEGLVFTSGQPYLKQGTANPIKFRILPIFGQYNLEGVIRDLVWGADMSFTKIDMSGSLPWVLKVADSGALELSRSHCISGITV